MFLLVTLNRFLTTENIIGGVSKNVCWFWIDLFWSSKSSKSSTVWKKSKYGIFSGPHFSVCGVNSEIYFVSLRIQSEYGKIWIRKNCIWTLFTQCSPVNILMESIFVEKMWIINQFYFVSNEIATHIFFEACCILLTLWLMNDYKNFTKMAWWL